MGLGFSLGKRAQRFSLDQEVETGMWVCALRVSPSQNDPPKLECSPKAGMLTQTNPTMVAPWPTVACADGVWLIRKSHPPANSTPFCRQRGDHNHGGEEPKTKGKGFSCTFSFGSFSFPLAAGGAGSGAGLCLQDQAACAQTRPGGSTKVCCCPQALCHRTRGHARGSGEGCRCGGHSRREKAQVGRSGRNN